MMRKTPSIKYWHWIAIWMMVGNLLWYAVALHAQSGQQGQAVDESALKNQVYLPLVTNLFGQ